MALFRTEGGSSTQLLDAELAGLDQLDMALPPKPSRLARIWAGAWPKLLAVGLALLIWQVVVWTHWRPEYVLPSPWTVFDTLFSDFGDIMDAARTTLERGVYGFALAVVIGTVLGGLVARNRVLRTALGSMITGLQTMPSIAWFPLAILLFKLTDGAILFVVVLGARGVTAFRHIILPAALPSFVAGLKQGWAFAWRSLLAGELLVQIPGTFSLGQRLQLERELADSAGVISVMIVILVIGILIDAFVFGVAERAIRRRYGLIDSATTA